MTLEKFSMAALAEKLAAIGGGGKLAEREWRIRCRLNWHDKARSTVRHMLYGERRPDAEEAKQIEAAHLRYCAEKVKANAAENEAIFHSMRSALAAMEASDAEFFRPHVEAVRELLFQLGNGRDQSSDKGGP